MILDSSFVSVLESAIHCFSILMWAFGAYSDLNCELNWTENKYS
jgi:hypothetical protein